MHDPLGVVGCVLPSGKEPWPLISGTLWIDSQPQKHKKPEPVATRTKRSLVLVRHMNRQRGAVALDEVSSSATLDARQRDNTDAGAHKPVPKPTHTSAPQVCGLTPGHLRVLAPGLVLCQSSATEDSDGRPRRSPELLWKCELEVDRRQPTGSLPDALFPDRPTEHVGHVQALSDLGNLQILAASHLTPPNNAQM